jgi:hypothetical protein
MARHGGNLRELSRVTVAGVAWGMEYWLSGYGRAGRQLDFRTRSRRMESFAESRHRGIR